MATIVGGLGTSHSPQLSMPAANWADRANWDRTTPLFSFEAAAALAPEDIHDELTAEVVKSKHARCQSALELLHRTYLDLNPDVVVVVGDDQNEMFLDDGIPAIAVFRGATLTDRPRDIAKLHPSSAIAEWAYHGTETVERPGHEELASHLVGSLSADDFDLTQLSRQPDGRSIGHAFTFVHRRIMIDQITPLIPVMLNTDHAPNILTPSRCWQLGRAIRRAIDSWGADARVLLVASGGLSHFVVDEQLDRRVLDALRDGDNVAVGDLPVSQLVLGTSEIRNWIVVSAALNDDHAMDVVDYVPAYRSEAATGCGMAFAVWRPATGDMNSRSAQRHEQGVPT